MKSKFLKIVLPAFAFMLAITASLAFTSNASEDDALVTVYIWDDTVTPQECIPITIPESLILSCNHYNFGPVCGVVIAGQNNNPKHLYSGLPCNSSQLLRKP